MPIDFKKLKKKVTLSDNLLSLRKVLLKFEQDPNINFVSGMIDTVGNVTDKEQFESFKFQLLDYCDNPTEGA